MKKTFILLLLCFLLCAGCSSNLAVNGKVYQPYGLLSTSDSKAPEVRYEPCWGNIIWGCILFETIIGPIYFFGFDMYQPVEVKK